MSKKRSSSQEIEHLERKLQKLRRKITLQSSSDTDDNESSAAPGAKVDKNLTTTENATNNIPREAPMPTAEATTPSLEDSTSAELDPELLIALEDETNNTPRFGDKINDKLAELWEPILRNGLTEEAKDRLFKDYLVPVNCTLLQAPKLNNEISEVISEPCRNRDKKKEAEQQQLGIGISVINKALTILLTSDNKIEAIRIMSDGCRILSDIHYQETQLRMRVINYELPTHLVNVVQNSERDETLYGNQLGEKIKASKTNEKQGMSTSNSRSQYQYRQPGADQESWPGLTRFHQNRGGRRDPDWEDRTMSRRPPAQQASTSRSLVTRP